MSFSKFIEQNLLALDIEKILDNDNMCIAILINFSKNNSLFLQVDGNTDEIYVSILKDKNKIFSLLEGVDNISMHKLMELSNYFLLRAWIMKNNFNYQDAIQLELWDSVKKENLIIQIQAISSNLEIYQLVNFE